MDSRGPKSDLEEVDILSLEYKQLKQKRARRKKITPLSQSLPPKQGC